MKPNVEKTTVELEDVEPTAAGQSNMARSSAVKVALTTD